MQNNDQLTFKTEDIILTLQQFGYNYKVDGQDLQFQNSKIYLTQLPSDSVYPFGGVLYSFRNFVATYKSENKVINTGPSSAWQHFKHQYFPEWLKKKFPVKHNTVTITGEMIFPHYKRVLSDTELGRGYVKLQLLETVNPYEM